MRQFRQALFFVFSFVAFLLHCSQMCLAAGHTRAVVPVSASTNHDSAHVPCHSSETAPQESPERCPDCAGHVFLKSAPAGAANVLAPGLAFSLFYLSTLPLLTAPLQPYAGVFRLERTALSPPRYLSLSVLRL